MGNSDNTGATLGAHASIKKPLHSPILLLLPLVLSLLLLRGFAMELLHVDGVSMEPSIRAGSTLFVNRAAYGLQTPFTNDYIFRWSQPEKGDIVVFRTPGTGRLAVKRVVGTPGERYELTGLGVQFTEIIPVSVAVADQLRGAQRLGGDEVFVLGDNTRESVDSRSYGPVAVNRIRGKVLDLSRSGFAGRGSDRQY